MLKIQHTHKQMYFLSSALNMFYCWWWMDGWINFPSGVNKVIRAEGTFKYHQNTRANIEKALYIIWKKINIRLCTITCLLLNKIKNGCWIKLLRYVCDEIILLYYLLYNYYINIICALWSGRYKVWMHREWTTSCAVAFSRDKFLIQPHIKRPELSL